MHMQDPSIFPSITPLLPEHERLKCPRCDSNNTKFCYYNNYNLTQPRHFCKNCRRYWTKGGALRNIPVGGGTRSKNVKRSPRLIISSSSNSNSISISSSEVVAKSGPTTTITTTGPSEASVKVRQVVGDGGGGSFSYLATGEMNLHSSKKISIGNNNNNNNLLGNEGNGDFSGGWPGFKVI